MYDKKDSTARAAALHGRPAGPPTLLINLVRFGVFCFPAEQKRIAMALHCSPQIIFKRFRHCAPISLGSSRSFGSREYDVRAATQSRSIYQLLPVSIGGVALTPPAWAEEVVERAQSSADRIQQADLPSSLPSVNEVRVLLLTFKLPRRARF